MVTVNNASELTTQLNAATGGEIIELAAGINFGRYTTPSGKTYSTPVTIRSLDTNNRGIFGQLNLNSGNVILDDILFDYVWQSGDQTWTAAIYSNGHNNITIQNCEFLGDNDGSEITGRAIELFYMTGATVTGNKIDGFNDGNHYFSVNNLVFTGNEIIRCGSDGIQLTTVNGATISGNIFHDWVAPRASAHVDAIQLLRNLGGCNNINIKENVFDMANGYMGQTFHAGEDGYDMSNSLYIHTNITYENNLIMMGHANGFSLSGMDNLTIRKNTMQEGQSTQPIHSVPIMSINPSNCINVTIEDNIYPGVNVNWPYDGAWTVSNNHVLTRTNWGVELLQLAAGNIDGYNDLQINSGAAHIGLAGSRLGKRTGGWNGQEIITHAAYPGGNKSISLAAIPAAGISVSVLVTAPADVTPPTISGGTPGDDATDVAVDANITVQFSEAIQFASSGQIIIRDIVGASNFEVFDVTTDVGTGAGTISISGNVLTIDPTVDFSNSTGYAIQFQGNPIEDLYGNAMVDVTDTVTYNYTTVDAAGSGPQLVKTTTPASPFAYPASSPFQLTHNMVSASNVLVAYLTFESAATSNDTSITGSGTGVPEADGVDMIVGATEQASRRHVGIYGYHPNKTGDVVVQSSPANGVRSGYLVLEEWSVPNTADFFGATASGDSFGADLTLALTTTNIDGKLLMAATLSDELTAVTVTSPAGGIIGDIGTGGAGQDVRCVRHHTDVVAVGVSEGITLNQVGNTAAAMAMVEIR